jgi:hypothetical protein
MAGMQRGQQAEAVGAQGGVFDIHHHVVEEGVDRALQRRQRLQRGGVVAALEGGVGLRLDLGQRGVQRNFGRLP